MVKYRPSNQERKIVSKYTHDKNTAAMYKRLIMYAKPYWPMFVISILATVAYGGFSSLFTYLLKPLLDKGLIAKDMQYIKMIPLAFGAVFLMRAVSGIISSYCMAYVGKSVVMKVRQDLFDKLMTLTASYYDNASSGQLLATLLYNTAQVAGATTSAITNFVQSLFFIIGLLGVMFFISWKFTLLIFATAPIYYFIMRATSRRQRGLNLKIQESMGAITHIAEEAIDGYRVVRTFGGQDHEMAKFQKANVKSRHREMKVVLALAINNPAIQFVGVATMGVIIYFASSMIGTNSLSPGSFVAIIAAMLAMLRPLKSISRVNGYIQKGLAGAISIFNLLDADSEPDVGETQLERAKGRIEFKDVNFAYDANNPVLHGVNLVAEPGEVVALVGRSGAGKSSIISLLPRFYDISSGEISVDGTSIYDMPLRNLRDQISLVTQNITLFNDTVANNIAYAKPEATREDIVKASELSHAMEYIKDLPKGLDTLIGENGVKLSGGQRQRLALARAMLRDTPILILDEATSSLDTESERYIQAALETIMQGRTTLVIAHRLSTIENAHKIVVVDKGLVVEVGSHKELLAKDGYYARLHALQYNQLDSTVEPAV